MKHKTLSKQHSRESERKKTLRLFDPNAHKEIVLESKKKDRRRTATPSFFFFFFVSGFLESLVFDTNTLNTKKKKTFLENAFFGSFDNKK